MQWSISFYRFITDQSSRAAVLEKLPKKITIWLSDTLASQNAAEKVLKWEIPYRSVPPETVDRVLAEFQAANIQVQAIYVGRWWFIKQLYRRSPSPNGPILLVLTVIVIIVMRLALHQIEEMLLDTHRWMTAQLQINAVSVPQTTVNESGIGNWISGLPPVVNHVIWRPERMSVVGSLPSENKMAMESKLHQLPPHTSVGGVEVVSDSESGLSYRMVLNVEH